MGCRSDYMAPNAREIESRKLIKLLIEVGLCNGEAPYYGDVNNLDNDTDKLCKFCQKNDVSSYSLELQMWWRDHSTADEKRVKAEALAVKTNKDREELISKMSDYERGLLGLNKG